MEETYVTWLDLLGRIAMAGVFLVSAVHKLVWYQKAIDEFRKEKIPLIPVSLPITILLHFAAPVCLILDIYVVEAALALAVFTLLATLTVHHFWTMEGEQRLIISRVAMANVAIAGGLLALAAARATALP
jgi:putative oxidoreductase